MDSIIIFCAKYLFIAVVLLIGLAWLKANRRTKLEMFLAALAGGILAIFLMKIAGSLYYDQRPFVTQHIKPLVSHGADNGFPSEHTVFTMTLTAVLYFYDKRLAVLALVFTLAVGIGRVLAHVHSPVDIMAGLVIGAAAGAAGYQIARMIFKSTKTTSKEATE